MAQKKDEFLGRHIVRKFKYSDTLEVVDKLVDIGEDFCYYVIEVKGRAEPSLDTFAPTPNGMSYSSLINQYITMRGSETMSSGG